MCARGLGLLVFLFRRCWGVKLCKGSNSARDSGVKSQVRFENMCLWLTECLNAQTFSFLVLRLPEPQQENSLTIGAGRWADCLFVINLTYLLFQQLKDTKQVSRGAVWGLAFKRCNPIFSFFFFIVWRETGQKYLRDVQIARSLLYVLHRVTAELMCNILMIKKLEGKKIF